MSFLQQTQRQEKTEEAQRQKSVSALFFSQLTTLTRRTENGNMLLLFFSLSETVQKEHKM